MELLLEEIGRAIKAVALEETSREIQRHVGNGLTVSVRVEGYFSDEESHMTIRLSRLTDRLIRQLGKEDGYWLATFLPSVVEMLHFNWGEFEYADGGERTYLFLPRLNTKLTFRILSPSWKAKEIA